MRFFIAASGILADAASAGPFPLVSSSRHGFRSGRHHQAAQLLLPTVCSAPSSSMSGIMRGVRRTFRERHQRPPGRSDAIASRVRERRLEREAAPEKTFKILKGKKDVADRPVPKPLTRRARFFDPEDKFGKRSLVYQMKTGHLDEQVKALEQKKRETETALGQSFDEDFNGRGSRESFESRKDRGRGGRDLGSRSGFGGENDNFGASERLPRPQRDWDQGFPRQRNGRENDRWSDRRPDRRSDRGPDRRFDRGPDRESGREFGRGPDEEPDSGFGGESDRDFDRRYQRGPGTVASAVPLSVPYTTAASQFLYGRSVVEAALRSGRRKLYRLYVYNGENRPRFLGGDHGGRRSRQSHGSSDGDGDPLERLARHKGVTVQVVDERWQRLLDKMSKGRPHNGYILEASPLPQPPLKALGRLRDDGGGFGIVLDHQSREDADINGTAEFVPLRPAPSTQTAQPEHKPLVLLLDQVLDPGNLGAILRSASFLGVSAVAVSKRSSASMTSVALKASAGAAEAMALFSVDSPATFLSQSKSAGWKVYAAVAPSLSPSAGPSRPVLDLDALEAADPLLEAPGLLVMGSEGEGLPRAIRREADVNVCIANRSGSDVVDSLNVSVATGLLCASFLKGAARRQGNSRRHAEQEQVAPEAEKPADDVLGIW